MTESVNRETRGLPIRSGPPPGTTPTNPHQQLDQNPPIELQEELYRRARALPGVAEGPSSISVLGARALLLEEAGGPPEAFLVGREFAHLHPPYDGSLHLTLPPGVAAEVLEKGWGEIHPLAGKRGVPSTVVMIYGPRDEEELEAVWGIVRASYDFARGKRRWSAYNAREGETMDSNMATIEQEVLSWPGVTSAAGRFGAVAFRYGKREIGHIHRDGVADLPVTPDIREKLLSEGRARPHRAGVKGYISYPIQSPEDVSAVIEILGQNYDRAKAAAERRAASQQVTEE